MAWTTPHLATPNTPLTAAIWNSTVRDDLAETMPAKATATGRLFVSTAANAIAERVPTVNRVDTSQTRNAATFADLATTGPAVTSTTGPLAIVSVASFVSNDTANQGGYMGVTVSGATTTAAVTTRALRIMSGAANEVSRKSYVGTFALTAGSNTFTAKYSTVSSGIATYSFRELLVIPL